jgi:hypothetical protein
MNGALGDNRAQAPAFELVIERGGQTLQVLTMPSGAVLSVGRGPDCSLTLDDPSISR